MPITYTNRKRITYYLCQGVTKTGKPRYYFAREPKGELVEQIPEGFEITESVNGIVSLAKDRPGQILPKEVAAVEKAVQRHPKSNKYRVNVKHDRIEIYERVGPDADELMSGLAKLGFGGFGSADRIQATMERRAQFSPVFRFTLMDEELRTFYAERMCYLGSIDDWIHVAIGQVDRLARKLIPKLGTDAFFELV